MGLKKRLVICIFLVLIILPMVLGLETQVKVKTQPGYAVTVRYLDVSGRGTLENGGFLDQIADANGEVSVTYSSDTVNKIDISIMIKNSVGGGIIQFVGGPVQLFNNNGEHIKAGWPIEIDSTTNPPILVKSGKPDGVESPLATIDDSVTTDSDNSIDVVVEVENEQLIETPEEQLEIGEIIPIDPESPSSITGNAIGNVSKSILTSKMTYFIIFGLIGVLVFVFVIRKKLDSQELLQEEKPKEPGYKVTKYSDLIKANEEKKQISREEELVDAERKLEEAKKELADLKNRDEKQEKIRQAREQFERDKAALEELEKE